MSPRQTTVYQLTASGPGRVTTPSTTVEVNPVVQSSLSASPMEVQYRRIHGEIIEQQNTTLNWSSSNSDAASLDPGGPVGASGTKSITLSPTQSGTGPVDEQFKYTLNATNACGGSETKTVAVHLKGSIEPIPTVLLHSVFFPTAYPTKKEDPTLGLVGRSGRRHWQPSPPDSNSISNTTLTRSCRLADTRTSAARIRPTIPYPNSGFNTSRISWFRRESPRKRSIPQHMASETTGQGYGEQPANPKSKPAS